MDIASEIAAKMKCLPQGALRRFKGTGIGTEEDIQAFIRNQEEVAAKIKYARAVGCHLEEISLILQIIDFWLRVWFVNTAQAEDKRKREFGALLDQCEGLNFDALLAAKLREQNSRRILAVHGYVIGKIRYDEFPAIAREFRMLAYDSVIFVINNCGSVVSTFDGTGTKGEMIIDVLGYTADLRAKKNEA